MSVLEGAHNFVLNLNISPPDRPAYSFNIGLEILLKASYPEATHDSSDHPTSCFPGTREQPIEDITTWAVSSTQRSFRMMWLHGLAGVGKSSLAQSCAERVGATLAAAFFFSRPNKRDKPTHFFTSIAYQLTTRYPSYRDKLEEKIRNDPTLVQKSLPVQFRELIVAPIQELQREGQEIKEGVIFIDGLDECAGQDAQRTIIDIIATSVRDQTTPFIWAFFSRPEPILIAQFSVPDISDLCWQLTLPVSRDADGEIELYLRDAFRRIRMQYGIPSNVVWPSEDDIRELVDRSAGLFVYPACIMRYIGEGGALGPEEQLHSVLRHPGTLSGNPWSHLDAFYTLIMEQIPKEILLTTLKLLLSYDKLGDGSLLVAAIGLGFSQITFITVLSRLFSVVNISVFRGQSYENACKIYHASFTDFLNDPVRSGRFYVRTPELCAALLRDLIELYNERGVAGITVPWVGNPPIVISFVGLAVYAFWELGSYAELDEPLLEQLSKMDYRQIGIYNFDHEDAYRFYNNIPPKWRHKIMRPYFPALWRMLFRWKKPALFPFVLGVGGTKNVLLNNPGYPGMCCCPLSYRRFEYIPSWRTLKRKFLRVIGRGEPPLDLDELVKLVRDHFEREGFPGEETLPTSQDADASHVALVPSGAAIEGDNP